MQQNLGGPGVRKHLISCFRGQCCRQNAYIATMPEGTVSQERCEDVSIIGAGIAGTYTAWRLRNQGLKIGIYECTDRVGGKMFTRQFAGAPDLNIEFGAMRFIPNKHRRMMKASTNLNLNLKIFPEAEGIPEKTLYYFRERHLKSNQLGGTETPYLLRANEYLRPNELRSYLSSTLTNYTAECAQDLRDLFTVVTHADRMPLYKQSYQQAALKCISMEAYRYLRDVDNMYSSYGGAQATSALPFVLNDNTEDMEGVVTIENGMDSLPKSFLGHFLQTSRRHKYCKNKKLLKIRKNVDGVYTLYFTKTRTSNGYTSDTRQISKICSKRIILAIPTSPLKQVDWPVLRYPDIYDSIDSVVDSDASKVFLLYDFPWWREVPLNFRHVRSDLPTRQTYDFGVSSTGKAVLLVSYADYTDAMYWRQLQKQGTTASLYNDSNRATTEVIKYAHMHLSKIYNTSAIPSPLDGMMMAWDKYPYSGAWGFWKPGKNWLDIKRKLTQVSKEDPVYIIHGHYGTEYDGWAEGALQTADMVLTKFGLEPYVPLESWI